MIGEDEITPNLTKAEVAKNKFARKFEERIVPEQKRILNQLRVGTFQEKAGRKLSSVIDKAFLVEANYSSDDVTKIADKVQSKFTRSGISTPPEVREVVLDEKGLEKHLLVIRDSWEHEDLVRTQVLEIPKGRINKLLKPNSLVYNNYFFTQEKSGLTCDLLDLTQNKKIKLLIQGYPDVVGYVPGTRSIHLDEETSAENHGGRRMIPEGIAHEAGHQLQFSDTSLISQLSYTLGSFSVFYVGLPPTETNIAQHNIDERNASAFSLAVIRKYRQLGLDLMPGITNKELINAVNESLRWYEGLFYHPKLRFSKQKRQ